MHRHRAFVPPLTINRMIPQDMLYIVKVGILDSIKSSRDESSVFSAQKRRVGTSGKPTYLRYSITTVTYILRHSRNEWPVHAKVKWNDQSLHNKN